jgi:hypothetical protein
MLPLYGLLIELQFQNSPYTFFDDPQIRSRQPARNAREAPLIHGP